MKYWFFTNFWKRPDSFSLFFDCFFLGLTLTYGQSQDQQQQQQPARLRRRLSDKDKERRSLVRRSSSKRKDKENGGSTTSLERQGSSGAIASAASDPRESLVRGERSSRSGSLRRAGSAEASSSSSPRSSSHAFLCRTGSQDTPSVQPPSHARSMASSSVGSSEAVGSESSQTRSLPRI